jgi:hypothetical protein
MIAIDVFTSCRTYYTVFVQAEKKLKLGLGKGKGALSR